MIEIIAFSLLTLTCIVVTFLVALIKLWKNPPSIILRAPIHIPPIDIQFILPENVKIQLQKVLPIQETDKPLDEPIPSDIIDYCEGESDEWAKNARKLRVRSLKRELGSWDAAFRALQREDDYNG